VTPLDSSLSQATTSEEAGTAALGGRNIDFFAAPYILKLRLNQDLVPAMLDVESESKELVW